MSFKASERSNSSASGAATGPKTLPYTSLIIEVEPWGTDVSGGSATLLSHAQRLRGAVVDEEQGCPHASPLPSPIPACGSGTRGQHDSAADAGCLCEAKSSSHYGNNPGELLGSIPKAALPVPGMAGCSLRAPRGAELL